MSYDSQPQFFRIDVPEPSTQTELVLGTGPNGFHGIMGRVANGGIFIGAGGYPLGVPSQAASYEGLKRVHTGLTISIGGMTSLILLARAATNAWDACAFSVAVNLVSLGAGIYASSIAGTASGTPSPEGTFGIYADKTVSIVSPLATSCTGGVAASLNGGLIASVNSTVAVSLNATAVSMNGAYSATVSATNASVVGDSAANVSSRAGTAYVEGPTVQIGRNEGTLTPGYAYRGGMTGGQKSTKRVDIRSDGVFTLEAGKQMTDGANTRMIANESMIRQECGDSDLTLDDNVTLRSGQTGVLMALKKIKMFVAQSELEVPRNAIMKTAEVAQKKLQDARETIEQLSDAKGWLALAAGVVGTAGIMTTAMKMSGESKSGGQLGLAATLPIMTGALTGMTTLGVLYLVESKLKDAAKQLAQDVLDENFKLASEASKVALEAEFKLQSTVPTNPSIEVTNKDITLSAGGSQIKIGPSGIEIKAMIGMPVTINGQKITGLLPSTLEVD